MLTVNDRFPVDALFKLPGVFKGDFFQNNPDKIHSSSWRVFVFYPKDFTTICPTELKGFSDMFDRFKALDCEVFGVSTDSPEVHLAWIKSASLLKDLNIPLLSDNMTFSLIKYLGISDESYNIAKRATFIIDPSDKIKYVSVNDMKVGRNPAEVLRILKALQTEEMTLCFT